MRVNSITKRMGGFWPFQLGGWSAYAIVVVLYTIPLANDSGAIAYRLTLMVSCFVGTCVLRIVCRQQWRRGFRFPQSLLTVLLACFVLTYLCSALSIKAEYTWGTELRPFNLLLSLTTVTNAGFVFLSWSALYFGIKYYQAVEAERRRVLVAESAARDAELRALRYQVHPHFLFNTLNAISTLVMEGEREAATAMITRLADFFRATLDERTSEEVPLQEELFLTSQYLEIEKLRLGERLQVEIDVDPSLRMLRVPHLVLQPLVENAIRHGIAPRRGHGCVTIDAHQRGETLLVRVTDDGLGKQSRENGKQNASHGIGLANINRRLRELYGEAGALDLNWPDTGGCQAVLRIPYSADRSAP